MILSLFSTGHNISCCMTAYFLKWPKSFQGTNEQKINLILYYENLFKMHIIQPT